MCGRYHFGVDDNQIGKIIKQRTKQLNLTYKTGEIFPNDKVLCIMNVGSKLDLAVKKWGIKNKTFQINARIETIKDKNAYKGIKDNRCVLICDGFYEWDEYKNKYLISFKEDYMYLAAIYNNDNELLIITKEANDSFKHIHNRQPLVLNLEEIKDYLLNKNMEIMDKEFVINQVNEEISLF